MKSFLINISLAAVVSLTLIPALSSAQSTPNPQKTFDTVLQESKLIEKGDNPDVANITGTVLGRILTATGIFILVLVIYAGYLWATARGNDQQIANAKKILIGGIIGLLIIFTASAVVNFVLTQLADTFK